MAKKSTGRSKKIEREVDPRGVGDRECANCGSVNADDYVNCFRCHERINKQKYNVVFGETIKGRFYGAGQLRKIRSNHSPKDFLQPYKQVKGAGGKHKTVPNKDYIKAYGAKEYKREELKHAE